MTEHDEHGVGKACVHGANLTAAHAKHTKGFFPVIPLNLLETFWRFRRHICRYLKSK
jgi:hypothetical protein